MAKTGAERQQKSRAKRKGWKQYNRFIPKVWHKDLDEKLEELKEKEVSDDN